MWNESAMDCQIENISIHPIDQGISQWRKEVYHVDIPVMRGRMFCRPGDISVERERMCSRPIYQWEEEVCPENTKAYLSGDRKNAPSSIG